MNSPSYLPDIFRFPEPTTPTTPFPDIQDRLTPVNRRHLTDRKFDGVYQRLATLKKTEIKNNQQAIMSMLSTAIHLLQGSISTPPLLSVSTIKSSQPQPVIYHTSPANEQSSHLPDIFRFQEPTTPTTPFPDIQDRLTAVNRRHLTDRKLDEVYQRLATLEKKNRNKEQPASHNVHVINSHSSPARKHLNIPSTMYHCQPIATNPDYVPLPANSNKSRHIHS
ncbi:unnamed protein product [Mytilus edulis]|uniref:Uncharacterized protein n=1 Tax=Mytilus edulis TaxID=6550 RepID=A0A8S3SBS3_MYTED|nr:unnamed protein product [Mytilus edulis]